MNTTTSSPLYDFGDFKRARTKLLAAFRKVPSYHTLIGESGVGKTALIRDLQHRIQPRTRFLYLCASHYLSPAALVRNLAKKMQLAPTRGQVDNTYQIVEAITNDSHHTILVLDDSHFLPDHTLAQLQNLAEPLLQPHPILSLLLVGLPELLNRLQRPLLYPLFRRLQLKLEINGLTRSEVSPFLKHILSAKQAQRFTTQAIDILFERANGRPALLQQLAHIALQAAPPTTKLDTPQIHHVIDQWELP